MDEMVDGFQVVLRSDWDQHPVFSRLTVASDMDGDSAMLIQGLTDEQRQAVSQIKLERRRPEGAWEPVPFDDKGRFPGLGWLEAPCWYLPFDHHPYFAFNHDIPVEPEEWRALIPNGWEWPSD